MSLGCFYPTLAATLQPFYGAYAAYSPSPTDPTMGFETEGFNASFVVVGVGLMIANYFYLAMQETAFALKFQVGGGAILFAACL
ncbi:hypothetical protein V498_08197, partial [Pseudogymnoascus sp. VKM F-4517 (FW-2822)]